jgi:hypothetical protein
MEAIRKKEAARDRQLIIAVNTCGAADHFARDCLDGKDTNEQQVAHGTGLVSLASMIILHDTIDHHDLADNPKMTRPLRHQLCFQ